MNWTILDGLAEQDVEFQDSILSLHTAIEDGLERTASLWATRAAHIAHELMDRADDLDAMEAMERDNYYYEI